jgi:hypothetical protein
MRKPTHDIDDLKMEEPVKAIQATSRCDKQPWLIAKNQNLPFHNDKN